MVMRRKGWKEWKKARSNDGLPNSNKYSALSTIRRSNTCRLFRNVYTLLAVPSKGITLRERTLVTDKSNISSIF